MNNRGLTVWRLRQLLSCDYDTGIMRWRLHQHGRGRAVTGRIAGSRMSIGYWLIGIDHERHYRHHLVWAHYHGRWPRHEIDHKRGLSDRIKNLREATRLQNCKNTRLRSDNRTGSKGVDWRPDKKKWRAQIGVDSRQISLGHFDKKSDAEGAYARASAKFHGRFGRLK